MERDLSPVEIGSVIRSADIDDLCDPQTGNCVGVAVAIKEVFSGGLVWVPETNGSSGSTILLSVVLIGLDS